MKFLDSSGLSTVIKYIKEHVPLLNDSDKIPAEYLNGETISSTVKKNITPTYFGSNWVLESTVAVKSSCNTGFIITNYAMGFVAFVMISINSNGEIAMFYIKPIINKNKVLDTYMDGLAICLIKTSNGWVLNIKGVVGGGQYIRPMGDLTSASTDLVLNLKRSSSTSSGTVVLPEIIS